MTQTATKPFTATRPQTAATQAAPSRMRLDQVVRGKQRKPVRVVLYGVEGVGKSTFGANAPGAIFLGAEDGTSHLDVTRFPSPTSWQDVMDALGVLEREPHEYRTVVLDTLDWAEPLLWAHICKRDGQATIEAYGYGKGYAAALDEWRVFLAALERLREKRGMHVVLLAHAVVKTFKNPEGPDFDRYNLKVHDKAAGLVKEWADVVAFANFETLTDEDRKTKRVRGLSTGARLIYTVRTAAYDAKNRHSLPDSLPLDWAAFEAAIEAHQVATPDALRATIAELAPTLAEAERAKVTAALGRAGDDTDKLAQLLNYCRSKAGATQA